MDLDRSDADSECVGNCLILSAFHYHLQDFTLSLGKQLDKGPRRGKSRVDGGSKTGYFRSVEGAPDHTWQSLGQKRPFDDLESPCFHCRHRRRDVTMRDQGDDGVAGLMPRELIENLQSIGF